MAVRRQREQHRVGGLGVAVPDTELELEELEPDSLEEEELLELTLPDCCNGWALGRACAAAVCS
jgi:hypothetical protein